MSSDSPTPTLPAAILRTDRLRLRAFTEADIDDVLAGVSDPGTQRWLPIPGPGQPYTREAAQQWCLESAPGARASGDGQQWAAIEATTDRFVGSFGLTRTRWQAMSTEVGYWVAPWARGHGFATEAVAAMARWTLDQGFQRVELKAATGNTASRRVAEKTGFHFEGTERNAMPLHEGRADLAVYSLIPGDLG
ncbi:GNAT family N-acetyltransferase [Lipingzhangella halophila]|uniref:GNAT family N-acetyltransferase n=1 Tax=Lipingzhangella halophila TaxID=1783352 RepID=UPI00160BA353|nr:GNAT family N-acetyltransferase [Lipingzhangella halophila]